MQFLYTWPYWLMLTTLETDGRFWIYIILAFIIFTATTVAANESDKKTASHQILTLTYTDTHTHNMPSPATFAALAANVDIGQKRSCCVSRTLG